jgi:hypothetical protein
MFGCEVVRHGIVTEVSVLTTSTPAEPGARVLTVHPQRQPTAVERRPASTVAQPDERVFYGGELIRRPNVGQVLGVR